MKQWLPAKKIILCLIHYRYNYFIISLGEYIYAEASEGHEGDKVGIITNPFIQSKSDNHCVRLWSYMEGENIGSLDVYYLNTATQEKILILSLSGQKFKKKY